MPALTAIQIAEHVKEILESDEPTQQEALKHRLTNLIVSAMSPHQNLIYGYLRTHEWSKVKEVAEAMQWTNGYTSNIMYSMLELGLVERQAVTDRMSGPNKRFGLHYQWRVKPLS